MTLTAWLAPDPEVPQRDRLLDIAAVQSRLRLHLGRAVAVRAERIKYRIGESLRVVYRAAVGDREALISARTLAASRRSGDAPSPRSSRAGTAHLPSAFEDAALGVAFWVFPSDRRLEGLDALLAPPPDLRAHLNGHWRQSRLVSYVPEKCAVSACLDNTRRMIAYVKQYSSEEAARCAFDVHAAIAGAARTAEQLRVPRPLFLDTTHRMTGVAAAPGIRLADLDRRATPRALGQLGRAVAELHGLPPPAGLPRSRRATPESLAFAAALVGRARPSLRRPLEALAGELIAAAPAEGDPVLLHSDLHLKNALVCGHRISLIDLDQAASGDAAADLGTLLAWLRAQAAAGLVALGDADACGRSFLEGYASVRELPPRQSLDWHTAAALLEQRALRAIARVRLPLLPHLDALIAESQRLCPRGVAA